MAIYHVLNGDCLAEQLRQMSINQDFIICRECLIDGKVKSDNLNDFWKIRAEFIVESYDATIEDYVERTVKEFEKLSNISENSEVCLWFENDLFCQVNMWFVLSMLPKQADLKVFRVFPISENADIWKGFGNASPAKLEKAYSSKVQFEQKDLDLGVHLWEAYQKNDFEQLKELSKMSSNCFEYLQEVCHIDRFPTNNSLGRPEQLIKDILESKPMEFYEVFQAFSEKEGIYGFGDLQVKSIYERYINLYGSNLPKLFKAIFC
jgi:Domain of unknown function (DUF1835)